MRLALVLGAWIVLSLLAWGLIRGASMRQDGDQ